MLRTIRVYFEELLTSETESGQHQHKTLELATAVLMIEISLADDHIDAREREAIRQQLMENFDVDENEIDELIAMAEKEVDHAVSLYEFTRLLNDTLTREERVEVIRILWRIAYADSVLDKYEEYYIRKVADLLYVSHADYIKSKLDSAS